MARGALFSGFKQIRNRCRASGETSEKKADGDCRGTIKAFLGHGKQIVPICEYHVEELTTLAHLFNLPKVKRHRRVFHRLPAIDPVELVIINAGLEDGIELLVDSRIEELNLYVANLKEGVLEDEAMENWTQVE